MQYTIVARPLTPLKLAATRSDETITSMHTVREQKDA